MTKFSKRTRLFIARRFQIRYISLILLFMFATAMLTGYTVYVTTWIMFGEKLAAVYPQGLLLEIVNKVNMVLLLRLIFLSPMVILIGLVLSNRIAGPIYRIQRFLRTVIKGDYSDRIHLREKDELQDMAGSLNDLVEHLAKERTERKEGLRALKKEVENLEVSVIAGDLDREKLLKCVREIEEKAGNIKA